jgi:hypothetical protein
VIGQPVEALERSLAHIVPTTPGMFDQLSVHVDTDDLASGIGGDIEQGADIAADLDQSYARSYAKAPEVSLVASKVSDHAATELFDARRVVVP